MASWPSIEIQEREIKINKTKKGEGKNQYLVLRRLSWQVSRSCLVRRQRARFSAVRRRSVALFHKVVQSLLAVS